MYILTSCKVGSVAIDEDWINTKDKICKGEKSKNLFLLYAHWK